MKKNKMLLCWGLSLIVIGAATLVLAVSNIIGTELPDVIVRIIGGLELCALPVLGYTSVKMIKSRSK